MSSATFRVHVFGGLGLDTRRKFLPLSHQVSWMPSAPPSIQPIELI